MALCDERRIRLHGLDLSTMRIEDDSREPESERALRKRLSDWVMSRPSVSPEYEKGHQKAALINVVYLFINQIVKTQDQLNSYSL